VIGYSSPANLSSRARHAVLLPFLRRQEESSPIAQPELAVHHPKPDRG
jgi:hypothetical protein